MAGIADLSLANAFARISNETNRTRRDQMSSFTRRSLLVAAGSGLAANAMVRALRAAEGQSPDQLLDDLIKENQENGIGSGFDNASRNVKLPKRSLPTL